MAGDKPSAMVDFVAGTIAGSCQIAVGHPFDTIKTKLQTQPKPAPGKAPVYSGAMDATRKTLSEQGVRGMYRGMGAPLATVALFNAVLFSVRGRMERLLAHADGSPLTVRDQAVAGAGAGVAVSFLAAPTELIKCRLQSQLTTAQAAGVSTAGVLTPCGQPLRKKFKNVARPGVRPSTRFAHLAVGAGAGGAGAAGAAAEAAAAATTTAAATATAAGAAASTAPAASTAETAASQLRNNNSSSTKGGRPPIAAAAFSTSAATPTSSSPSPSSSSARSFSTTTTAASSTTSAATSAAATAAQHQQQHLPQNYRGPIDVVKHVWKAEGGPRGLFRGLTPTLAREVPGNAVMFGVYEVAKRKLALAQGLSSTSELGTGSMIVAGGIAGTCFWIPVFPADVVKSRWQVDSPAAPGGPQFRSIFDCAAQTVRGGGFKALYRGFGPAMVRAFPANAVCFSAYELVVRAAGSVAG